MLSGVWETDASRSLSRKGLYLFVGLQFLTIDLQPLHYLHYTFHTGASVYHTGMTNQCFKEGPINTYYKS